MYDTMQSSKLSCKATVTCGLRALCYEPAATDRLEEGGVTAKIQRLLYSFSVEVRKMQMWSCHMSTWSHEIHTIIAISLWKIKGKTCLWRREKTQLVTHREAWASSEIGKPENRSLDLGGQSTAHGAQLWTVGTAMCPLGLDEGLWWWLLVEQVWGPSLLPVILTIQCWLGRISSPCWKWSLFWET